MRTVLRLSKQADIRRLRGSITTRKTPSLSVLPGLRFKVGQRCSTWQEQCSGSPPSLSRRCERRPRAASRPSMHVGLGSAARTRVRLPLRTSEPSSCGAKNLTVAGASLKSCFTLSRSPSKDGAVTPCIFQMTAPTLRQSSGRRRWGSGPRGTAVGNAKRCPRSVRRFERKLERSTCPPSVRRPVSWSMRQTRYA